MTFALPAAEAQALLDATLRGELPDDRGRFGPFGGQSVPSDAMIVWTIGVVVVLLALSLLLFRRRAL